MASGEAAGALSRNSMKTDLFQRFDAWKQLRGMWVSTTFQDLSRISRKSHRLDQNLADMLICLEVECYCFT